MVLSKVFVIADSGTIYKPCFDSCVAYSDKFRSSQDTTPSSTLPLSTALSYSSHSLSAAMIPLSPLLIIS